MSQDKCKVCGVPVKGGGYEVARSGGARTWRPAGRQNVFLGRIYCKPCVRKRVEALDAAEGIVVRWQCAALEEG